MPKVNKIQIPQSEPEKNTKQKAAINGLMIGFIAVVIIIFALAVYLRPKAGEKADSPIAESGQQEENVLGAENNDGAIDAQAINDAAKADGEALNRLANVTLDGYYKDEETWCQAASDRADTRQHLYYVYADEVARLNTKYADYGIVFEADVAIVGTFKDKCEEYGFILE